MFDALPKLHDRIRAGLGATRATTAFAIEAIKEGLSPMKLALEQRVKELVEEFNKLEDKSPKAVQNWLFEGAEETNNRWAFLPFLWKEIAPGDLPKLQAGVVAELAVQRKSYALADAVRQSLAFANLAGVKLPEYLDGSNFRNANLQGANLQDANLSNTNLQQANLSGANLQRAWLVDADLQKADLQRANLIRTDLRNANLTGANLQGAIITITTSFIHMAASLYQTQFSPQTDLLKNSSLEDVSKLKVKIVSDYEDSLGGKKEAIGMISELGISSDGKPFSPLAWGRKPAEFDRQIAFFQNEGNQNEMRDFLLKAAADIAGTPENPGSYGREREGTVSAAFFPPHSTRKGQLDSLRNLSKDSPLEDILKAFTKIRTDINKEGPKWKTSSLLTQVNDALKGAAAKITPTAGPVLQL